MTVAPRTALPRESVTRPQAFASGGLADSPASARMAAGPGAVDDWGDRGRGGGGPPERSLLSAKRGLAGGPGSAVGGPSARGFVCAENERLAAGSFCAGR